MAETTFFYAKPCYSLDPCLTTMFLEFVGAVNKLKTGAETDFFTTQKANSKKMNNNSIAL